MAERDENCGSCELPISAGEESISFTGSSRKFHTNSRVCISLLKQKLFTDDEIATLRGIVANYINEQGSILNDYDKIGEENELRTKLGLRLIKSEDEMTDEELAEMGCKPKCTCHPMPSGTNPNCRRHGLEHLQPRCDKLAPQGFAPCTRALGHDGPCALPLALSPDEGPYWD